MPVAPCPKLFVQQKDFLLKVRQERRARHPLAAQRGMRRRNQVFQCGDLLKKVVVAVHGKSVP